MAKYLTAEERVVRCEKRIEQMAIDFLKLKMQVKNYLTSPTPVEPDAPLEVQAEATPEEPKQKKGRRSRTASDLD